MSKKKIIIIIIIVVAISFGLYTVLPLFTNTVVDEPLPTAEMSLSALGITNYFPVIQIEIRNSNLQFAYIHLNTDI